MGFYRNYKQLNYIEIKAWGNFLSKGLQLASAKIKHKGDYSLIFNIGLITFYAII